MDSKYEVGCNVIDSCVLWRKLLLLFLNVNFFSWLGSPSGPRLSRWGFEITFDASHSVRLLWTSDRPVSETSTPDNTGYRQETDIHASGGVRTRSPSRRRAADPRLIPRGHWDRRSLIPRVFIVKTYIKTEILRSDVANLEDWSSCFVSYWDSGKGRNGISSIPPVWLMGLCRMPVELTQNS